MNRKGGDWQLDSTWTENEVQVSLNLNYGVNFRIHLIPCNKTITFFLRVLNNKKKIIESKPPEQTSHVILKREFALLHTGRTFNR